MSSAGILALWKDCVPGREADLERWFQGEHLKERMAVPGFRYGRRFEAEEASRADFNYYETDAPEVLTSPAYLERLDNPTPLTREIMTSVMINVSRTICRVQRRQGAMRGAWAVTMTLSGETPAAVDAVFDALAGDPSVARVDYWVSAEDPALDMKDEEKLRGRDEKIAACLLIETLREASARDAARRAAEAMGDAVEETGIFRFLCHLGAGDH